MIKTYYEEPKNNLFIFRGIVRSMYQEDNVAESTVKKSEFGVLADVLRTLQMEEMEEFQEHFAEVSETTTNQDTKGIIVEINNTLKEIAETQKKILEEIKRIRTE